MRITDKIRRLVDEYLLDLNAAQAAIRAGYSPRTAKQIAYETLNKP
ncbi:terminase small subunit, partial [Acinetobacter baumannii]